LWQKTDGAEVVYNKIMKNEMSFEKNIVEKKQPTEVVVEGEKFSSPLLFIINRHEYLQKMLAEIKKFDPETYRHVIETANIVSLLCGKIGLTKEDSLLLIEAALTHDWGKTEVSTDVLRKNGEPSAAEWEEIRKHVRATFEKLEKNGRHDVARVAVAHHDYGQSHSASRQGADRRREIWPVDYTVRGARDRREKEPRIVNLARILTISDAFASLLAERPYKHSFPIEDCVAILKKEYPTSEDGQIVEMLAECARMEKHF
jgi:putative two-component system response regulator